MKKVEVVGYDIDKKPGNLFFKFFSPLKKVLWILFLLFLLLLGGSFILDGLGIYTFESNVEDYQTLVVVILIAFVYFFLITTRTANTFVRFLLSIMLISGTIIIIVSIREYVVYLFQYISGILTLVTGVLILINTFRQIRDRVNFLYSLVVGSIYLALGVLITFSKNGLQILTVFIGIYLILFSLNILWEIFSGRFLIDKIRWKKHIITFPTILSTFLTVGLFNQIELLTDPSVKSGNKIRVKEEKSHGALDKENISKEHPDMIVFIHIREGILGGAGHVDLYFDGKVYCFGEYDHDASYFKGLFWDGVLAVMSPREHIKRAIQEENKILVAYGLKLNEKEKKRVQKQIDKIMEKSYPWKSKAEEAKLGLIEGNPEEFTDPASSLYNFSNAQLYKFKLGSPYKTYYLLGQNCAIVANKIIRESGIHLRKINGMVTPGTYLNFMEELYAMPNSKVFERTLYKGKVFEESDEVEEETEPIIA